MDWFSTALDLAGVEAPGDRIIDGISLSATLQKGEIKNRYVVVWVLWIVSGSHSVAQLNL